MPLEIFDTVTRLVAATIIGMAYGLNRDLHGKATGIRTLGLVALASAVVTIGTIRYLGQHTPVESHPDAMSRVMQGLIQGILTGIGFIGAGVIVREVPGHRVRGLTTAATVWLTASMGIVCGLGQWVLVVTAVLVSGTLLIFGGPLERWLHARLGTGPRNEDQGPRPRESDAEY